MTFKIGIIGAGAIGCFVGAHLLNSEASVYFVGRERLGKKIKKTGIKITLLDGQSFFHAPEKIQWLTNHSELPLLDLIIITTKSQDTKAAIFDLKPYLKSETKILSLQNGISNTQILNSFFTQNKVISVMVPYNVIELNNEAHFKQSTSGHIYLGEQVEMLKGIKTEVIPDMINLQWGKLVKNLNNALNALSNKPLKEQLRNSDERRFLALVISEALSVLKNNSIKAKNNTSVPLSLIPYLLGLPNFLFNIVSRKELKIDPTARLSMWQDLELKRKTEIDYLNGEILNLARKSGGEAPYNEKIVSLIRLAESGELELARKKYQDLIKL